MRLKALEMAFRAGKTGAHLGGGLSSIEILAVLYGQIARLNPSDPDWEDRDRILISKAHCVLAYYTALSEIGYIEEKELDGLQQVWQFTQKQLKAKETYMFFWEMGNAKKVLCGKL